MKTLLCFGLGYSARRYIADHGAAYDRVIGTSRYSGGDPAGTGARGREIEILVFDGITVSAELTAALGSADRILVSIPPSPVGDPVLSACGKQLASLPRLQSIVYLSTIGVYGDHAGADVDETTLPAPLSPRSHARLAAERAWQDLGTRVGCPVAILRLAGIYGPGRNTLIKLIEGRAMRIVSPQQVFNRIHVADVAQVIDAAFARGADGIFNVADEEPCAAADIIVFAAGLIGIEPPPAIKLCEAQTFMSTRARRFYSERKRVRPAKLKKQLGVRLIYPTYRDGLRALHAAGDHNIRARSDAVIR
jgi:dTDP-4-dehydrorhamnose reductase